MKTHTVPRLFASLSVSLAALAAGFVGCGAEPPPPKVAAPALAPPEDRKPAAPPIVAAPTGPRRVALRAPDSPVVAIRVAFAAGSADDPPGKEGVTRLTATQMVEGGTQALSFAELSAKLYPLAATIGSNIDRDETVLSATVPVGALDRFYPLLRDVLLAPRLDAESFTRLRARQTNDLTSELRGSNDEELGKEALQALLYPGHPYEHPTQGTETALAALTLDDVKAQYARAFCRDRVIVGVAGGYPEGFDDTVLADVSRLPPCAGERAPLPDPPPRHGNQVLIVDKPGAGATAISIGFTTPVTRADGQFPGLLFATDALGLHRQSTGRLFQELREKRGLNYGDYAYAEFFEQDGFSRLAQLNVARRQQLVSIWIRPVKRANSIFALKGALRVYGKFIDEGLTDADFARTREFLTRQLRLDEQTEARRLGYAMDDRTYGQDRAYADRMRDAWQELDAGKLKALAAKLLETKNLAIALVASDGDQLASELQKGDAAPVPAYDAPKPADVQAEDREIVRFPVPLDAKAVRVVKVADLFK